MTTHHTCIDTWISETAPDVNYGDEKRLGLDGTGSNEKRVLIYFTNPAPIGSIILSAVLTTYSKGNWAAGSHTVTARRVTENWREQHATWNNRPAHTSTNDATDTKVGPNDGARWQFDVTAMMQDDIDGNDYFGMSLTLDTGQREFMYSSEASDHTVRPTLDITWTTGPTVPADLTPAGGKAVSSAKPIVSFTRPVSPGGGMQSIQVQVNATDSWGSPSFDSGVVTTTDPSLDLSTTAFGGISIGATRYWRARWTDTLGNTSDWSQAVAFTRQDKSVLTLVSPSVGVHKVTDRTPPIDWTFGGTQTRFHLWIYDVSGKRPHLLYEKEKSTATTVWTLPSKIITSEDDTYNIVLRVWDDVDRARTENDPPYVEESFDFTYVHSGTPPAPHTLVLTGNTPKPSVLVGWDRATEPDGWVIRVANREVLHVAGSDAFVSGTHYEWEVWNVPPRVAKHISVEAHTDGVGSSDKIDDTVTTTPIGLWVVDTDDNTFVAILDTQELSASLGDDGQMYYPVGNQRPIRVTSTVRGLEGTAQGILSDFDSVAVDKYHDDLLDLKERSTKGTDSIQLIANTLIIPIRIGQLSVVPLPNAGGTLYSVNLEFFQIDNFPVSV